MNVSLVLVKPDGTSREAPIRGERRVIGRTKECDIRIPMPSVSRRHAEVVVDEDEGSVLIRDLGSSNGTFVNTKRITEAELSPGDLVCIGPAVFVVRMTGFPKEIDAAKSFEAGRVRPIGAASGIVPSPAAPKSSAGQAPGPARSAGPASERKTIVGSPTDSEGSSFFDFDLDLDDEDLKKQPRL